MTQDKKRKQKVRAFAAKTGMSYAAARQVVLAGNVSSVSDDQTPAPPTDSLAETTRPHVAPASSLDYVRACTLARQAFGLLANTSELAWQIYGVASVQGRDGDQIVSKGQYLKNLLRADALELLVPKGSWQEDEQDEKVFRRFYPSKDDQLLKRGRASRGRCPKAMPVEAHRAVAQAHQEAQEALRQLETLLAPHLQYPGTLLRLKACRRLADLVGRQQAAFRTALEAEYDTTASGAASHHGKASTLELGFNNEKISNPTVAQLRRGLADLPGGTDSFAIYWKDDDSLTYIQVAGAISEGGFALEYQTGSIDAHFVSGTSLSLKEVQDAFVWYSIGDERWKTSIQWKQLDIGAQTAQQIQLPSNETQTLWITKRRARNDYPKPGEHTGKWLIFIERAKVDGWWIDISNAVGAGQLGHAAQVSTARPNPVSRDPSMHVICVYSYDHRDVDDVLRVRNVLRKMGVTWKIGYKTNAATRAGKYQVRGDTHVSTYWE